MFTTEFVPVILRKLALKIEADGDDDERTARICESTFRIPVLDHTLAASVRLPIVAHCFDRDELPLWNVHHVTFEPPDDTFTATLHAARDMPPGAVLELLKVRTLRVYRAVKDRRDLTLEFVTRHEIARGDVRDLADLITAWETGSNLITLATVQIPLDLQAGSEAHAAAADQPLPMDEPTPPRRRRTH
jgi:hypothetical protein